MSTGQNFYIKTNRVFNPVKSGFYMTMFVLRVIKVFTFWGSLVFPDKLGFVLFRQ